MADKIPEFDPNKPFETADEIPEFDPNKPFETYMGTEDSLPQETQILDVPAPLAGRTAMKAFGTDVGSKINYYKNLEENKDLDIIENPYNKGEIIARQKGTTQWLKEDPSSWQGWKEFGKDILDVPVDVGQALATGAASAFGSTLTPFTPVAGGALGATIGFQGTEALRQGIGSALYGQKKTAPSLGELIATGLTEAGFGKLAGAGIPKQKFTQIAAESPKVAAKALQKAEQYFLPKGQAPTAAEAEKAGEYLYQQSRGLIPRATENILPIYFGGSKEELKRAKSIVPPSIVDKFIKEGVQIDPTKQYTERSLVQAVEAQKPGAASQVAIKDIRSSIKRMADELGPRYEEGIAQIKEPLNLDEFKGGLISQINEKSKAKTEGIRKSADDLKYVLQQYFTPRPKTTQVTETSMQNVSGLVDQLGNPIMTPTQNVVEKVVPGSPNITAKELKDISNKLKAEYMIGAPRSVVKAMPPEKQMNRGIVLDITKQIDDEIYKKIPDETLRSDYKNFMQISGKIEPLFKNDTKAAQTLSNAYNSNAKQKQILQDTRDFDKYFGTNLEKLSSMAFTAKRFGTPSMEQVSSQGRTSTGRFARPAAMMGGLGTLIGGYSGSKVAGPIGGTVGGAFGGAVGAGLGGMTATDAVLNRVLAGQEAFGRLPFVQSSAWDYMSGFNPYARQLMLQPTLRYINEPNQPEAGQ